MTFTEHRQTCQQCDGWYKYHVEKVAMGSVPMSPCATGTALQEEAAETSLPTGKSGDVSFVNVMDETGQSIGLDSEDPDLGQ